MSKNGEKNRRPNGREKIQQIREERVRLRNRGVGLVGNCL